MTFLELSEWTQQHRSDYYTVLMQHHALIIEAVGKSSKNAVSKALHITPSQFSGVFACIIAYHNLQKELQPCKK